MQSTFPVPNVNFMMVTEFLYYDAGYLLITIRSIDKQWPLLRDILFNVVVTDGSLILLHRTLKIQMWWHMLIRFDQHPNYFSLITWYQSLILALTLAHHPNHYGAEQK